MRKLFLRFPALLVLCLCVVAAEARVVRVEVLSRTPLAGSAAGVPAYEKIAARVYFAVKPGTAHNSVIVDLDKAERNAAGEVEFSADLFLLRPVKEGNGTLLLEIPNRGGKNLLSLVDGGKADPADASEEGDAWLLRRGFTFASLGWQWDVTPDPASLRLYAPVAYAAGKKHIQGLLRDDFTPSETRQDWPLGHVMGSRLGGTEYPAADTNDARDVLTVRDEAHGLRTPIARGDWSFTHAVDGRLEASDRFIHLNSGFQPGRIYELVYVVQDPVVAGLGFAAVRDFVSWMKHAPEAIAPVKYAYAAGISQSARFLRDSLFEGFNADEQGRMVLDGVLAHVGGAGRGSFNYRFAQPSRDAQPMSSIDWPTDIYPFTDQPETDPHEPDSHEPDPHEPDLHEPLKGRHGLLDAARDEHVTPKIFFSHTSYEYWGRAASLIHTSADGSADIVPGPDVRIYFYTGLQHYSVDLPPKIGTGDHSSQQLPSPLPVRWFWRAMIANMDAWVRTGTPPPASRYPLLAVGMLKPPARLRFPAIPGLYLPASATEGWDLDFGENWRAGVLTRQPPVEDGAYPALVPDVNPDGNDYGGIELPEIAAPLATYTGWNFRAASIGAPTQRVAFLGSYVPFAVTRAAATAAHDPRRSIEERYKDYADYRMRFQKALDALVGERYLLAEDAPRLMERSALEWKLATGETVTWGGQTR